MYEKLHTSGHNLYWINETIWIFQIDGICRVGTLEHVVSLAVKRFGFSKTNILEAVEVLIQNLDKNHDSIHFGMYKTYVYTFHKEFSNERKAS